MKFTGEFIVKADRARVFERLNDPQFFASCLEGVKDLNEIDREHYTAVLETRVAYIRFRFDLQVALVEIDEPRRVVARVEGTPKGVVGRLVASAVAELHDVEGGTRVAYDMDVALAGKLGSIGQPVLKSKAKEMQRSFVDNVNASFEAEPGRAEGDL